MPPNPPSKAHGFAMRSMSLRDMQIPNSEKKILGPPLPNPGDAPARTPPTKPCAACRFAECKFPNLNKNNSWPSPLPNPGYAPVIAYIIVNIFLNIVFAM